MPQTPREQQYIYFARIGLDDAIQRQNALLDELKASQERLEKHAKASAGLTVEVAQEVDHGAWTPARRAAVSRRMKAYWAGRRKG